MITLILLIISHVFVSNVSSVSGNYRVTSFYQGVCRSLETLPDGSVQMGKTGHKTNQIWNLTNNPQIGKYFFRLSTRNHLFLTLTRENLTVSPEDHRVNQWFELVPNDRPLTWSAEVNSELAITSREYRSFHWLSKGSLHPPSYEMMLEWFRELSGSNAFFPGMPKYVEFRRTDTKVKDFAVAVKGMTEYRLEPIPLRRDQFAEDYWSILPMERVVDPPTSGHPFYAKFIDFPGMPIYSSAAASDAALYQMYFIVMHMTSGYGITKQLGSLVDAGFKIVILGKNEKINMITEYAALTNLSDFRNLGATSSIPIAVCAEENLLCDPDDVDPDEDTSIKSIASSLFDLLFLKAYPNFVQTLTTLHTNAVENNKWVNSLAYNSTKSYFIQGVQCWFNVKPCVRPPNGRHNHVGTRGQLWRYDPDLMNELNKWFPGDMNKCSCHDGCPEPEVWGVERYPFVMKVDGLDP